VERDQLSQDLASLKIDRNLNVTIDLKSLGFGGGG